MARRWTPDEETRNRRELHELYVVQNKTIGEIAPLLGITENTVYDRLIRLQIPSAPELKPNYLRKKKDVWIPTDRSEKLAEFFGIMLGDGHISHFQTVVTLGSKELEYVTYVANLLKEIFKTPSTISVRADGYCDVYIGSVEITKWLKEQGLVSNKVASQVSAPAWIFEESRYMRSFLRGFFDTDGSFYLLRYGRQISFTNHSLPLLHSLRNMLLKLEFRPSEVSCGRVIYLTRRNDVSRFFKEIQPANTKHIRRFEHLTRR